MVKLEHPTSWHEHKILDEQGRKRRWFKSNKLDAVLWLDNDSQITRFQITFSDWNNEKIEPRILEQHVLTYDHKTGLKASYVPDESSPFPTPKILVPEDCRRCCTKIAAEITSDSSGLPSDVSKFIIQHLSQDESSCL